MARQIINIGTAVGAGNGDPARTAFDKCNDNFEELYAIVSDDQGVTVPLNLTSEPVTEKVRLNGSASSISGNSLDGVTNYGLLVFTPTQTQVRGASFGVFTSGLQRLSIDSSGSAAFSGSVSAASFVGPLTGNATTATTATNLSGGTVAATTGSFSGAVSTNGASIDSSATTFSAYQTPFNLNFGGGAQNLNIGVRSLIQTVNIGSSSTEGSTYRFGTGPTRSGQTKLVSVGTGGLAGSETRVFVGSSAGGFLQVDSPQIIANTVQSSSFVGPLTGNASTATTLQTARNINGVPFNGSANISINTNNAATFNNGGSGAASGSTFNGSAPITISYNTVGAPSTTGANASGNWNINVTGNASTATTATNQSGGTVSATTGSFSSLLSANNGAAVFGAADNTPSFSTGPNVGLSLIDTDNNVGSGGALMFGNSVGGSQVRWAGIKGVLTNASSNGSGHLGFSTRTSISDAALTEKMRLLNSGYLKVSNTGIYGDAAGIGSQASSTAHTIQNNSNFPVVQIVSESAGSLVVGCQTFLPTGSAGLHSEARLNNSQVYRVNADGSVNIGNSPLSNELSVNGSSSSVYSASSSSSALPDGISASIRNASATNGGYAGISLNALHSGAATSAAYIGAFSNSANNSATVVFGRRTGATAYAETMRIAGQTGHLLVGTSTDSASGGSIQTADGVTFPASQSSISDPNTLDDYEEGTWTPTVAGSNVAGVASYATRVGTYTKIGRVVTAHCSFDWTGGTGSGRLRITGLPFAASVTGSASMGGSRIIGGPTWGAGATPTPGVNPGATAIEFDTHTSGAATPGQVTYTATGGILFSITYEAA